MRVDPRLGEREDRREAGVRALEDIAPFVAWFRPEGRGEGLPHFGPTRALVLARQALAPEIQPGKELFVELRFDRAYGDVLAVPGLVDVVPGCSGVEDVDAS